MKSINQLYLFTLLLLLACTENKVKDDLYLELNNKELEKEIIKYDRFIDSIHEESYVVNVTCIEKENNVKRYVIGAIDGVGILDMFPYHFICKVGDKDVFFTMNSGLVLDRKDHNFFNLKKSEIERVMKKYFPEEYQREMGYQEKEKRGESVVKVFTIFEPEMYYLTFDGNKLIDKVVKRGMASDGVPIDSKLDKLWEKEKARRDSLSRIWWKNQVK